MILIARLGGHCDDTIVPQPQNPQNLNRYSYCSSNPLRFVDPSGHAGVDFGGGGGGGAGVGLIVALMQGAQQTMTQAQGAIYQYGPVAAQTTWLYGNQTIAAGDQLAQAAQNAGQGGNTAGPGGLDPNDPLFRKLIQQTGEADPIKAIAKASVQGPANAGVTNGVTVLGRFPAYVNTANRLGANFLNFVDDSWDRLTDAQRWAVNKQFLDDAIARSDTFRLASLVSEAKAGTYFRKELEYLISLGYDVVGDMLVKVK
ncbi:MAG: hypothetical protein WA077_14160 [Anaerolineae bacterium]